MTRRWRVPVAVAQVLVSIGLLWWLLSDPGFRAGLYATFSAAKPGWVLGGLAIAGIVQALCFVRWRIFLRVAGADVPVADCVAAFLAAGFSNLLLPGSAGGDVVRIALLSGRGYPLGLVSASVIMDRLCGSVSMILAGGALIGSQWVWLTSVPSMRMLSYGVLVYLVCVAAFLGALLVCCATGGEARVPAWIPARNALISMLGGCARLLPCWRLAAGAVLLSCLMLAMYFSTYYASARAFGLDLGVGRFVSLMPSADILAALPVSLGGLGVREAVFVFLLGQLANVQRSSAVAVSLVGAMMSAVWVLPGGLLWMIRGRKR